MEDERRYRTRAGDERDSLPRSLYTSYTEPSYSSLASRNLLYPSSHRSSLDYLDPDIEAIRYRNYGLDDVTELSVRTESGVSGISTGVNIGRSYISPLDSQYIYSRPDVSRRISPTIPEPLYERKSSLQRDDARISEPLYERTSSLQRIESLSSPDESSMLFVDGLPKDCTRREVGHLFRPFVGFKDIKVVHKEPRRTRDKATVLCFVEFDSPTCARTAMNALQGYKFDHKKADSPVLKIHFAHFPFKPPSADDR